MIETKKIMIYITKLKLLGQQWISGNRQSSVKYTESVFRQVAIRVL